MNFKLGIFPAIDPQHLDASSHLRKATEAVGLLASMFKAKVVTILAGSSVDELVIAQEVSLAGVMFVPPHLMMLPFAYTPKVLDAVKAVRQEYTGRLDQKHHRAEIVAATRAAFTPDAVVHVGETPRGMKDNEAAVVANPKHIDFAELSHFISFWQAVRARTTGEKAPRSSGAVRRLV